MRFESKNQGTEILQEGNSAKAWQYIRQLTYTTKGDPVSYLDVGTLSQYLSSIVQCSPEEMLKPIYTCSEENSFNFHTITERETRQALVHTKAKTAPGHDSITSLLVRSTASAFAPTLTSIFNKCIETSTFPLQWKRANVTAIWKGKGMKRDPSSYRPISVLPIFAGVLEKLLATQLNN